MELESTVVGSGNYMANRRDAMETAHCVPSLLS